MDEREPCAVGEVLTHRATSLTARVERIGGRRLYVVPVNPGEWGEGLRKGLEVHPSDIGRYWFRVDDPSA
ncbi:MAG: hypothetical protein ACYC96_06400 [Fimbriimonadaceae bacterium]